MASAEDTALPGDTIEAPSSEEWTLPSYGTGLDMIDELNGRHTLRYSDDECLAAIQGKAFPPDFVSLDDVTRLCILRGIRHHPGFATELYDSVPSEAPGRRKMDEDSIASVRRTINARAIMSNQIPEMVEAADFPYCIWYPDVASEETYRTLAKRYPQMRYLVGRACAVAGYTKLYQELSLLPEVSIAEEARDNGHTDIFDLITSQHVRWRVLCDYTRSVTSEVPAKFGLNGDTAVRSMLGLKREFRRGLLTAKKVNPLYHEMAPLCFNITEDWNIDEHSTLRPSKTVTAENDPQQAKLYLHNEEMLRLLWNPLPVDLPAGDKELLILMAAYYGDVDRYARLRRPLPVSEEEEHCITRGIYHNTMFAKWWSLQLYDGKFKPAIDARFIMNNDLSRIIDGEEEDNNMPYQFWFPTCAAPETYLTLARHKPSLASTVARALIAGGYLYQYAWNELDFEPDRDVLRDARKSPYPFYLEDLERRCKERGIENMDELPSGNKHFDFFEKNYTSEMPSFITTEDVGWDLDGVYNDRFPLVGIVETFVCGMKEKDGLSK